MKSLARIPDFDSPVILEMALYWPNAYLHLFISKLRVGISRLLIWTSNAIVFALLMGWTVPHVLKHRSVNASSLGMSYSTGKQKPVIEVGKARGIRIAGGRQWSQLTEARVESKRRDRHFERHADLPRAF